MTGLDMYTKLLSVFQDQEYEEDKAVNATSEFERLKFHRNSRYSPETFLSWSRKYHQTNMQCSPPPSMFRAKIDHPTFETWKSLSEKTKETSEDIQVSFLQVAEQKFWVSHNSTTKFKPAIQHSGGANQLDARDKKAFNKAYKEGTGVHPRVWKQLSHDEQDKVMKAKEGKGNRKPK
eukprot:12853615-Ditylum_brightwellii.AAC.1